MSEPIRIAQILGRMNGYGVERFVMNCYRFIDRDKIQFDFYAHDDSTRIPRREIEALGGRVFTVPPYQHLRKYLNALEGLFRQNAYPIVHAQIGTMSVFPLYAAMRAGVPIRIAHCHSTSGKGEWKRNAMKCALRPFSKVFATHCAAVSTCAGEWLFGKRAVKRGEVTIFNPVIDINAYRYNETIRAQVRREMQLDGRFVVGHVGRFCYQKNHEFLLDIFQAIRIRRPDALLMLVGDGDMMGSIVKKSEALGLRDDILMLGNRDDVNRLYQAMDVFVLPSRYEGFPAVAIEAQIAGLKVITSTQVTTEAKLRGDMSYLDLSAGADCWAREALLAETEERSCVGDFMSYDITVQAGRMEQFYMELLHSLRA